MRAIVLNSTILPAQLPLIITYALSYTVVYANGASSTAEAEVSVTTAAEAGAG